MSTCFSHAEALLLADTALVLVTVTDQKGSVPRGAGARMLVRPDGSILGTVGGGRYEAEAVAAALALHRQGPGQGPHGARPGYELSYSLRGVTDMDMICGGSLTMLLEYLPAGGGVCELFTAAREAQDKGEAFSFISRITPQGNDSQSPGGRRSVAVERFFFKAGALLPPGAALPDPVLRQAGALASTTPTIHPSGEAIYLLEHLPRPFRIILFGGGHVSRETALLAAGVDFHVTVVDDRPEFADPERFPAATALLAPSLNEKDCAAVLDALRPAPCDGIVIITRGHAHDRDALAAALPTAAGYIGMIGSKGKRAAVYKNLREQGWPHDRLDGVHSPVGLPIGAETPQEIAVSIVAELIAWRKQVRAAGTVHA